MPQNIVAAVPLYAGNVIAGIGVVVALVYKIRFLIVAARNSVLWLLACLLIPFAALVFLFVDPDSRRPFFLSLIGMIIAVGGLFLEGEAEEHYKAATAARREAAAREADEPQRVLESPVPEKSTLEKSEQEIRAWQAKLQAKKAQLLPSDTAGKAAFEEELQRYLVRLEEVKQARAAAGKQ